MEDLKELSKNEISKINGGIAFLAVVKAAPYVYKAAKGIAAVLTAAAAVDAARDFSCGAEQAAND